MPCSAPDTSVLLGFGASQRFSPSGQAVRSRREISSSFSSSDYCVGGELSKEVKALSRPSKCLTCPSSTAWTQYQHDRRFAVTVGRAAWVNPRRVSPERGETGCLIWKRRAPRESDCLMWKRSSHHERSARASLPYVEKILSSGKIRASLIAIYGKDALGTGGPRVRLPYMETDVAPRSATPTNRQSSSRP